MRMLLVLAGDALRDACNDYFETRGCNVDSVEDSSHARALLQFRQYDLIVADLPRVEPARDEILRLVRPSHRGAVRVLLTTNGDAQSADDSLVVLTTPQPLDAILRQVSARLSAIRTQS